MILALIVFARMWWITHHSRQPRPPPSLTGPQVPHPPIPVRPLPPPGEQR